jgi:GMP synthase-like glutamine amidotransferase
MQVLVIQHVNLEGPGLLTPVLEKAGWRLDVRQMDKPGVWLPEDLDLYKALVILGGPMNVYEEEKYPYLSRLDSLIKQAITVQKPVLGICLGGQLIAKALGARVRKNSVKEIGWYPVQLTSMGRQDAIFKGLPPEFTVFQWHEDTFELPANATLLAQGSTCLNQAFVYGKNAYGFQFHLEVTFQMISAWSEAYADDLMEFGGKEAAKRLLTESLSYQTKLSETGTKFLTNWVNLLELAAGH